MSTEKLNDPLDSCIKPPKETGLLFSREQQSRLMQDYVQCERDRLNNQKNVINSLLTEQNSSGIRFPGLSIVTTRVSKDRELVTFSNGIDSLEVEIYPEITWEYIPRLSGTTHMEGGTMHGYTFNSENPDEIRTIAKVTLQLLEIRRYPERFGYRGPISYIITEGKVYVEQAGQKPQLLNIPYIPSASIMEILDYIDIVFKNIPKQKSSGDFYPIDIS